MQQTIESPFTAGNQAFRSETIHLPKSKIVRSLKVMKTFWHQPNYQVCKEELLVLLRGKKSPSEMDQVLNLKSGQYKKWEESKQNMEWPQFAGLCKLIKGDFKQYFYHGDIGDVKSLLEFYLRGSTQEEVCSLIHISRSTLNRWLAQSRVPTVEQILQILHEPRFYLYHVLEENWGIENLPSFQEIAKDYKSALTFCYASPLNMSMRITMLSDVFNQAPGTPTERLARAFSLTEDAAQKFIDEALRLDVIRLIDGRFVPSKRLPRFINPIRTLDEHHKRSQFLTRFLTEKCRASDLESGHCQFNRFTKLISLEQYKRCHDIILESQQEIINIIGRSPNVLDEKNEELISVTCSMQMYNFSDILSNKKSELP